ncbi:MAG: glycosyltransferase family 4 protein [Hyphomicrobiaceae bacterium]
MLNASGGTLLGATNYYHNLLLAIADSKRIQPVLLTAGKLPGAICDGLPPMEVVKSPFAGITGLHNVARRAAKRLFDRDVALEGVLKANNIGVFSHAGSLGRGSRVATTAWIADFQHTKLPELFSPDELAQRDGYFRRCAEGCTVIIVSSEDARRDFAAFLPQYAHKARVLPFVSLAGRFHADDDTAAAIMNRYDIVDPYFHLPNQFWKHKNHAVVVEALKLARQRGTPLKVVSTGHTADRRHPDHFPALVEQIKVAGCTEDFKILGVVPYGDAATLMRYAVAIINPSLFEGWSTSVEESKSLGKTVILSDIPVHREQAPPHGHYFAPHEAEALLEHMVSVRSSYTREGDLIQQALAQQQFPERLRGFAMAYEDIVLEAYAHNEAQWART